ncbi:MAG: hypothetical protein CYPHOPRED_000984 [Cyphobasidiales sp. Tagirdzhanova-0007]|nr:MAG: hypothetical protein CYPHOPRED_000984 [Cyphobasidiales sp. Tagirdzhanova-0007]
MMIWGSRKLVHDDESANVDEVAKRGHAATDQYGEALVSIDPKQEAALRRKIDIFVLPPVFLLFFFAFIDRANVGNANIAGFQQSLHLKGYDYNIILSCFCEIDYHLASHAPLTRRDFADVSYILCEIPANIACKYFGPGRSAPSAHPSSRRALKHVEGIITTSVGIVVFFLMTDRPSSARWLNEHEKALTLARIKVENIGATEVLDRMDGYKILRGILNPSVLTIGIIFIFDNITVDGLSFFLPKIISTIYPHKTVITQQLYTVPPYIVGAAVSHSHLSRTLSDTRYVAGYLMFLASNNASVRYGATFIAAAGAFNFAALTNSWAGVNTLSDTTRAAAIGTNVMLGSIGGLISTWSFLPFDAPAYHIGNGLNLATSTCMLILSIGLLFWQKADNRRRDKLDVDRELLGLSQTEIQQLDWKHPAFRWLH